MLYVHKSNDIIQDVILECLCPLIDDIADEFEMLRRAEALAIYAPSPIAREILGRILEEFDDVWVNEESHNELLYRDDNKVIITLCDDGMIFVEDAYYDDEIKRAEGVLNYVYDGFSKNDVDKIALDTFSTLVFGFEDECGCDDEDNTELTTSTASYTVNGKPVTKEEFDKKYEEFENKYMNNIRDMLLNYCEFMDEMNEWSKLFKW